MERTQRRTGDRVRELAALAGWSALLAPLGILLHELGHFIAGRALGFSVQLRAASVAGGPRLGSDPDWMVALQALAGPAVTILLLLLAVLALRRNPRTNWALALAATAPLRFLVGSTYLWWVFDAWRRGVPFGGRPNFDEYNAASALGLAPAPLVAMQTAILIAFWAWVVTRLPRHYRISGVLSILVGAVVGIAIWMQLGPAILAATA